MKPNDTPTKKQIGIKWKLFQYLAIFCAIVFLILWLCQVIFLEDIYRAIKTREIYAAADDLTAYLDDDRLSEVAEEIAQKHEVCLLGYVMLDRNNALKLFSVEALKDCAIHNVTKDALFTLYDTATSKGGSLLEHFRYDAASKQYISIQPGHNGGDPESIIYTTVIRTPSGQSVLLLLNSVVSPVNATVKTLVFILITVSIGMLLLALGFAFLLSRRISRPIVKLNKAAKALAEGRYDTAFEGGSYREITELAASLDYASRELSKVDTLRRELIANTSHDLRTPLTMIAGYAEVMRDLPGENTKENAQIIVDEAHRLTTLVNDMLDVSKLESGVLPVNIEPFSLTEALREGLDRYAQFCERDGFRIVFEANEEITITSDASKLLQAFYNLVNNALTYTGPDKTVTVTQTIYTDLTLARPYVRITVSDTGDGIPEDKLPDIWERYYKVDAAHKRSAVGSGLGLSIVRTIMEMLGGRYGVFSQVGQGSSFYIELPLS